MRRVFVSVAIAAGCGDAGSFDQQATLVTVDQSGGFVKVTTADYEMDFAGGTKIHMPEHLRVAGHDVLAGPNMCNLEGQVGVALFPAVDAIAGAEAKSVASTIDTPMTGPAIAQAHVQFAATYDCMGANPPALDQKLSGESIFTFFPSGRIVRQDKNIVPSTDTLADINGACGCNTGGTAMIFFTSFWAFEHVNEVNVDANGNVTQGGLDRACTIYPGARGIGVAWSGATTRVGVNGVASHVFDFVPDGVTTLMPSPQNVFSAVQLLPSDPGSLQECANILDPLLERPINVGGVVITSTGDDGIFHDAGHHDTPFDIQSGENGLPPGFAVEIDLAGAHHASFTRDPVVPGHDVAIVQPFADHFLLYFPDALGPMDRITIEPKF